MTVLIHLVYALAYTVAGVSVGVTLPYIRPEMDPLPGWLAGAFIVLAGGLVHEVVTRLDRERAAAKRVSRLREVVEGLHGEVARLTADVERANAALEEARRSGTVVGYDTVMQEVKLLQSLVARLHDKRAPRPTPDAPPRPPQSRPRPPESGGPLVATQAPHMASPQITPPPAASPMDDAAVLETVREALKADRIDIYLQPIVSLPQRKHRFYEVFSRVRGADGTQIKPDRYLAIAEREGLIATVDNLLLMRCIQLIRETERRQHHIGFVSNISPATLGDAEFMKQFLHLMAQNQALVPKLVFELGQADLRAGEAVTMAILSQLAKLGFRFSMDQVTDIDAINVDALLLHDFRYLKIDCHLLVDPEMKGKVAALRKRIEGEPIDLIVEKIETENQLIEILDMGLDFGQGYLFGEPRLSKKPG